MTNTPFSEKGVRPADILGLVHTDVHGQISKDARGGFSCFNTFTDDHSGYGFIYLIEFKSEVLESSRNSNKRFILRRNSGSKVDLEEVQETTNKIDQLDVPMAELSSDEVQIEKVETTSSQGHTSSAVDSKRCQEAMESEMNSMYEDKVWTLIDPPEGVKPIGCKWVYKKKVDMDGNVHTYKARLVAKGYKQRQ
ncbi:putative retrotransposon Ty1-copia subclass protein [Abeliophyllum distichum]|uniref:Retrotransposon Ty1-copia subclass protein n=1 Tax=Abeliophyllum distichum TaxID=126358 RepID=A0ABD1NTL9_9LAMI